MTADPTARLVLRDDGTVEDEEPWNPDCPVWRDGHHWYDDEMTNGRAGAHCDCGAST